ncbi:MAG TPA: cupin domain-containing protein [Candidatus Dormibacteraeota bacterium]|nr:cupin domain-containing protein [Candidatus Dormibacteraeota bacterium]
MKAMKIPGVALLAVAIFMLAQARAQNASKVVFVSAKQLQSDIHKAPEATPGVSIINLSETPAYSALVARRTKTGLAEVHKSMIDVWYVIEGGGTLVTGGSLVETSETAPGELRGKSVSGGEDREIAKGDIVTIPAGVPHWVRKIDGQQIVYLVVKVPSAK